MSTIEILFYLGYYVCLIAGIIAKISVIIECVKFIVFFCVSLVKLSSNYHLKSWGEHDVSFFIDIRNFGATSIVSIGGYFKVSPHSIPLKRTNSRQ